MTGLYVFIGIVLFFTFLLSLKGTVKLEFDDEIFLTIKVLCFKIKILPKKPKPVDYSGYSYEKHQKRLRKKYQSYVKKQEKKEKKKAEKQKKKEELAALEAAKTPEQKKAEKEEKKNKPKRSVLDWLDVVKAVLSNLFGRFAHHFHIKVARLKINVATGDAASTAIMYGAVIQSVAYIIELLKKITNVDGLNKAEIDVKADYLSDKTSLDLCFEFSLRVWHLFNILFGTAFGALKAFLRTDPQKKKAREQALANGNAPMRRRRRRKKKRKNTNNAKTTQVSQKKA